MAGATARGAAMRGKLCVVTGATSGIGRVTATELARLGAAVVLVARDAAKGEATAAAIRSAAPGAAVTVALADLSSQRDVRALGEALRERHERVDVLVNNAGAIFPERSLTEDGIERTFAVNHLAYYLLTRLLTGALTAAAAAAGEARVVTVSSDAHRAARFDPANLQGERRYTAFGAYAASKLANVLFTYELARRLAGSGVTANCLHPGFTSTGFGHGQSRALGALFTVLRPFMIGAERGARTSVYLASSPEVAGVSGQYFVKRRAARSSPASHDPAAARELWQISERLAPVAPVTP